MNFSKFGLCVWNVWGDDIIDRPDNIDETITAMMIKWLADNGYTSDTKFICQFQPLNSPEPQFSGAEASLRRWAYNQMVDIHAAELDFPELDHLFIRWRWNIGTPNDVRLQRQHRVLHHYLAQGTEIIIWDDDFKMDESTRNLLSNYGNVKFAEISESALEEDDKVYVPYPIRLDPERALSNVLPGPGLNSGDHLDSSMLLAYVGNNYDREHYVEKYLVPVSNAHPGKVHLYGNWNKYETAINSRFPNIAFHPKANKSLCQWLYQHAYAVPMLAKDVYFQRGHITPRLYEAVMYGAIPVGFTAFKNHEKYFALAVEDADQLIEVVEELQHLDTAQRRNILEKQIDLLIRNKIFDVDEFFNRLEL